MDEKARRKRSYMMKEYFEARCALDKLPAIVARRQRERLARVRRERDNELVGQRLEALRKAAQGDENLMPHILHAVRAYATLGEICGVFRDVFGEYRESVIV